MEEKKLGLGRLLLLVLLTTNAAAIETKEAAQPAAAGPRSTSNLAVSGKPMHLSCNRSLRNLKTNKVECFGNVYIRRPTELMTADYIIMDLNTEDMHAEGNVVYFTGSTVIYGAKMDFNFATETGIIEDGRIESEKYELLGEYIERYSDDEFMIKNGEYTTCRDCPASWRLMAKSVDFQVEGYATLRTVFIKINEAPTLWVPWMFVPVKTKRQSGFLFPRFGTSQKNGFTFVQPFFWAISRSTDATLGFGYYTDRGRKGEGQFRFMVTPRTKGELNAYYLKDKTFSLSDYQNRWAMNYSHNIEFPWKIEQKLHWLDASDRDYARLFPEDIPGFGEPALVSDAGLSRAGRDASVWVNAKRIRNNVTRDLVGFDGNTVQQMPSVSVATVDHRIGNDFPLHWGVTSNYSRFSRKGPVFDGIYPPDSVAFRTDFIPGKTPLRTGTRFMVTPELYYTARAWDVLEVVPSVQYRQFFYQFDTPLAPTTNSGYLLAQTDFATTIEHVYSGKVKHKIRPSLTYSVIPAVNRDTNHPFNKQLSTSGFQFDENDIVPITNENQVYFVPLGNSLSYQVGNKFILKSETAPYEYTKTVDVTSGQSINFMEYRKSAVDRRPLSRFFTFVSVNTMRIVSGAEYYYYPYVNASTVNLNTNYIFAQYTRRLLTFQRSVGLTYSYNQVTTHSNSLGGNLIWSYNDYFQTTGGLIYEFPMDIDGHKTPRDSTALLPKHWGGRYLSMQAGLTFQSPSQCYRLVFMGSRTFGRGWDLSFNIPVNLSGAGFTSLGDSTSVAAAANKGS